MSAKVEPRLLRGLRDLLPEDMIPRQAMVDVIRRVYELYGFVPLSTPAIEYLDVLFGSEAGDEASKSIFFVEGPEDDKLGLRFDLTVPLARVVAQYRDLPRPFRRYQMSPVWRADKPAPGRFREFGQFDLDSVGVVSEVADTEIIAGMCDTLDALEVGEYRVRYSSRGILNVLLTYAGIPREQGTDVFRVLDKLEKVGLDNVRKELTEGYVDKSGDPIPGLGLAMDQVERIERFLEVQEERREDVLSHLQDLFRGVEGAQSEIDVVARIHHHLSALGYHEDRVLLDLSIARGLAYYTGPVFEAALVDAPRFGSVFSGGRYDDLVMRFLGQKVPATGASIGVDRLLAALQDLGRFDSRRSTADVLVTVMDAALEEDCLALAFELRRAGVPTELYLGKAGGIGRQLKHADRAGIPIALLFGGDEKERGVVTLKDLDLGRAKSQQIEDRSEWIEERPGQVEVARDELVDQVRAMLGRQAEGRR
jgi:histidyl-tRNA synthetase